jgi:hypothetical protein
LDSTVLYPPLTDACRFKGGKYGSYIFAGGRVGSGKRQHLLIEACGMCAPRSGSSSRGRAAGAALETFVATHSLHGRVELRLGCRAS